MRTNLSIICLNCFGSPLSFNSGVRLKLLATDLNKVNPDVICLQEIFTKGQREILQTTLSKNYNLYSSDTLGMSKGGLVTLVKKDIKLDWYTFEKYSAQGSLFTLALTDRFAGKGIQTLGLSFDKKSITIANTHLLCLYGGNKKDLSDHKKQAQQLISNLIQYKSDLVVCGDLNVFPSNSILSNIKSQLNIEESLSLNDITVSPANLNRGSIINYFGDGKSYRTDYTLVKKSLKVVEQRVMFKDSIKYGGNEYNLSDHYGVFTKLEL